MDTKTSKTPQKLIPLTVARAKFQENIADLVNTSGLPAFVMLEVVGELKAVLEQLAQQQYQKDLAEYEANSTAEERKKE